MGIRCFIAELGCGDLGSVVFRLFNLTLADLILVIFKHLDLRIAGLGTMRFGLIGIGLLNFTSANNGNIK